MSRRAQRVSLGHVDWSLYEQSDSSLVGTALAGGAVAASCWRCSRAGRPTSGITVVAGDARSGAGGLRLRARCSARMSRGRRFGSGSRRRRTPTSMPSTIRSTRFSASLPNPEHDGLSVQARADVAAARSTAAPMRRLCASDGRIVALWPLVSEYMRVDRDASAAASAGPIAPAAQPFTWLFDASAAADPRADDADADPALPRDHRLGAGAAAIHRRRSSRTTRSRAACCRPPAARRADRRAAARLLGRRTTAAARTAARFPCSTRA